VVVVSVFVVSVFVVDTAVVLVFKGICSGVKKVLKEDV